MKQNEICTTRLSLHAFRERDMDALYGLLTNEEIKKTYMIPDFSTREAADKMCRRFMDLSLDDGHFVRGIYLKDGLIGFLNDVEMTENTVEIGYVIHPLQWNRGYATEAVQGALAALLEMGFETVRAGYFEENGASGRVMEKAGMERIAWEDTLEYRGKTHRCIYYEKRK